MQATNGEIWNAKAALQELIKEVLPVKTAYWLTKLVRKADEQLRDIEAVRVKLMNQYGQRGEDGNLVADAHNNVVMIPENQAAFATTFNELLSETVEVEGLPMEKILLPSDNGLCISAATLLALEPFVEVA